MEPAEGEGRIGVLGGGISGLTFASIVPGCEVLERESEFGGLMRSIKESGYTFDLGSHIIFSKNVEVLNFMLGLIGENSFTHKRNTKVIYKGLRVKYPFENGLGDLPKEEAMECYTDYAKAHTQRESGKLNPPKNFMEWMYYRFGKGISEKYLYPYNRKVWDYPPEQMGIFWIEGRVPQPPLEDVRKAAMGLESEGYTHQLNFHYPARGGIQAVTDALQAKIERTMGRKCLVNNFEVKNIRKEGSKWVVKSARTMTGGAIERTYDRLVTTIHILDFLEAYDGVPKDVLEAAKNLKWNSVYLVMLGLKKPKLNDIHWAYIPDPDVLPNRISFPSNFSQYTAPEGHSSILAEITFDPNGKKARLSKNDILDQTIDDLHRIGILNKADVCFQKLVTCKYAYVVYDLDYQRNIKIIEDFVKAEGVTLLGRFSEFKYYNSDKCVERALELARL